MLSLSLAGAEVVWTTRAEGDLRPSQPGAGSRWARLVGGPVSWVRQVHGAQVVVASAVEQHEGTVADGLVTAEKGQILAMFTADCAPVALASSEGVVGAAHAGWSGVLGGVLERTVQEMRGLGASHLEAALGPCIRPECYEFGGDQLARLVQSLGKAVEGETSWGTPALDLPAAVRAALARVAVELTWDSGVCTACSPEGYFSHRSRGEAERQAMFVWRLEEAHGQG